MQEKDNGVNEKNAPATLEELMAKAESGDASAMAKIYFHFQYEVKNEDEAIKWAIKAYENGHIKSAYIIATHYASKNDFKTASRYYLEGIDKGVVLCYNGLAEMHYSKDGEFKNLNSATTFFIKFLCEQSKNLEELKDKHLVSEVDALRNLCFLFTLNKSLFLEAAKNETNFERALIIFSKLGLTFAQYLLAKLYSESNEQNNNEKAIEYLKECLENHSKTKATEDFEERQRQCFSIDFRKDALNLLIKISDTNNETIIPYFRESVFIHELKDLKDNMCDYRYFEGHNYRNYVLAITGNKKAQYEVLCNIVHNEENIKNANNYNIYWKAKNIIIGNDEKIYSFEYESKFDKDVFNKMIAILKTEKENGDIDASKLIDIMQENAPKSDLKNALKIKPSVVITNDYVLGENYFKGKGVEKNYKIALELFTKVVDSKDEKMLVFKSKAYKYLIKMHKKGLGTEKDAFKALRLKEDNSTDTNH